MNSTTSTTSTNNNNNNQSVNSHSIVVNSGMNKLAETAAQIGSSPTINQNQYHNHSHGHTPSHSHSHNHSHNNHSHNHNPPSFLEADASFASSTPSSQVVTSFAATSPSLPSQVASASTPGGLNGLNVNVNGLNNGSNSGTLNGINVNTNNANANGGGGGVGGGPNGGPTTTNPNVSSPYTLASSTTNANNNNNNNNNTTTTNSNTSPYGNHTGTTNHPVSSHHGNTSFGLSNTYPTTAAAINASIGVGGVGLGSTGTVTVTSDRSLSSTGSTGNGGGSTNPPSAKRKKTSSAKQHQLPMFLTKTYHMIDRCDTEIALWADDGESFVVKNVEKFATSVLPQYFKHSNFSSFARQLNFYGFRKLKAEPILTADYDARTASYVRFYHEHFQKGKPDLLINIKRATKSDVQSKDDVDQLRLEVHNATDVMSNLSLEFDRKLTEITFEMNSKIAALHGKIAELQSQAMAQQRVIQQQAHSLQVTNAGGGVGVGVGIGVGVGGQQQQSQQQQQQQQVQVQNQQQVQQAQQQQVQIQAQVQAQQQAQQQQVQQAQQQTQFVTPQQVQVQQVQQQSQVPQVPQQVQVQVQQVQAQQQYIQSQTQNNVGSGNKMGGLLAAGLSIKSPGLPPQQAHVHQGTTIPNLSDNMMLPPAQK